MYARPGVCLLGSTFALIHCDDIDHDAVTDSHDTSDKPTNGTAKPASQGSSSNVHCARCMTPLGVAVSHASVTESDADKLQAADASQTASKLISVQSPKQSTGESCT